MFTRLKRNICKNAVRIFLSPIAVLADCGSKNITRPILFLCFSSDAHTVADVDYKWKIGKNKGIEIVSSELAQFDLLRVVTENKASTNSKGEITHVFLAHISLLP